MEFSFLVPIRHIAKWISFTYKIVCKIQVGQIQTWQLLYDWHIFMAQPDQLYKVSTICTAQPDQFNFDSYVP